MSTSTSQEPSPTQGTQKSRLGATGKTRFLINLPPNLALEKAAKQSPFDLFAETPDFVPWPRCVAPNIQ
jgi:hypothetical protein